MIDFLRQWILSVTCGAMIVALANQLTPKGASKSVIHLIGGLILLITVVQPIMKLDYATLASALVWDQVAMDATLEVENQNLLKTIIGEETSAYILDKAEELGMDCERIVVTCEGGEGDMIYPSAMAMVGTWTSAQQIALTRTIECDLAIPPQAQTYETKEETP